MAYGEYGDPDGLPLILCHGLAGCRKMITEDECFCLQMGIRLIVPDRPGHGLSCFHKKGSLLSWAEDVRQLADALGLERFSILAYACGGPYGLACAHQMPERIDKIALVGSCPQMKESDDFSRLVIPFDIIVLRLARFMPKVFEKSFAVMVNHVCKNPDLLLKKRVSKMHESDQRIVEKMRDQVHVVLREATRSGSQGVAHDLMILLQPWGFDLQGLHVPTHIWHGEENYSMPIQGSKEIEQALGNCISSHYIPNQGQFLLVDYWEAIVAQVMDIEESVTRHAESCTQVV